LPLESFFAGPEVDVQRENVLGPGDILTEVFVPRPAQGHQSLYLKAKERPAIDFALVSVAISAQIVGGTIRSSRIVLGGVAPTPIRASLAEQAIEGRHVRGVNADAAGTAAVQGASPLSENGYKVALCSGLVARAVRSLR
jgi:xanthine dehydrogenase YagS FAD-binding subunit